MTRKAKEEDQLESVVMKEADEDEEAQDDEDEHRLKRETLKDDFQFLATFALPLCYSNAAWTVMNLISTGFISKLPNHTTYIAAQSYAMLWMAFCQQLLIVPLSVVVESLCATAFGAGKKKLAATWLHMCLLFALVLCSAVGVTWIWEGKIMQLVGLTNDCELQYGDLINTYARVSLLGIFPDALYIVISTWYQSDEIIAPSIFAPTVGLALTFPANYVFIHVMDMGFTGAPLATAVCSWVQFIVFMIWVLTVNKEYNKYLFHVDFSKFTKSRMKLFLWDQLLPQIVSTVIDESHNLVISIMVAYLGDIQIAAHTFAINVMITFFSIPSSFLVAIAVRVGNYLGAGLWHKARRMTFVSAFSCAFLGLVLGLTLYYTRPWLSWIVDGPSDDAVSFSYDDDSSGPCGNTDFYAPDAVAVEARPIFPWLAATTVGYCMMSAGLGALDGMARARIAAFVMGFGAWGVSVPLAVLSRARRWGLEGIWFAEAIGYAASAAVVMVILGFTNWRKEVDEARKRNEEEEEEEQKLLQDDDGEEEEEENDDEEKGGKSTNGLHKGANDDDDGEGEEEDAKGTNSRHVGSRRNSAGSHSGQDNSLKSRMKKYGSMESLE